MGLRSPVGTLPLEDIPTAPCVPEQDENHLGTDEESSKESSLQDSNLTELEGKMGSARIGAGTSKRYCKSRLLLKFFFWLFCLLVLMLFD